MKLSNRQVAILEEIAKASDNAGPYSPPMGPRGRPAKFLSNAGLVEQRESGAVPPSNPGGLWITEAGRVELHAQKNGRAPVNG